jgi:hypothetical protein
MTGQGDCGSRSTALHTFAVFCTPESGAAAWNARLNASWGPKYGYDQIAQGFQNDSSGHSAIAAITNSGWVTGTRNGHQYNGLIQRVFNGLLPSSPVDVPVDATLAVDRGTEVKPGNLGGWNNLVQFPEGHILTAGDVETIMTTLHGADWFNPGSNPLFFGLDKAVAEDQYRALLMQQVGKPWNKTTQGNIVGATDAQAQADAGPLQALQALGNIAGTIANPGNWIKILALVAGGGLVIFGGILIAKEMDQPATNGSQGLVSPPIYIGEGA